MERRPKPKRQGTAAVQDAAAPNCILCLGCRVVARSAGFDGGGPLMTSTQQLVGFLLQDFQGEVNRLERRREFSELVDALFY